MMTEISSLQQLNGEQKTQILQLLDEKNVDGKQAIQVGIIIVVKC